MAQLESWRMTESLARKFSHCVGKENLVMAILVEEDKEYSLKDISENAFDSEPQMEYDGQTANANDIIQTNVK